MLNVDRRRLWNARVVASAAAVLAGIGLLAQAADSPGTKPVAAPPPATRPADPSFVTRTYEIADLFPEAPAFDGAPSYRRDNGRFYGGGGGGSIFPGSDQPKPRTRADDVADLIRTIQTVIAPGTWAEFGGGNGAIRALNDALVVTQTEASHRAVSELLDDLRARRRPVRVRAHWVLVDRADLDKLLTPIELDVGGRGSTTRPAAAARGALLGVDPDALAKLPAVAHFRGELVMLSGQRAYVTATENRPVVTGLDALTDQPNTFDPRIEAFGRGLVLDVVPTLAADRRSATTTLRNEWSDLRVQAEAGPNGPALVTTRPAAAKFSPAADRYVDRSHLIATTVRAPVGKMVLVGGMTLDPTSPAMVPGQPNGDPPPATQPAGDGGRPRPQLHLFVEVTAG